MQNQPKLNVFQTLLELIMYVTVSVQTMRMLLN